jgi:hypothetical protein
VSKCRRIAQGRKPGAADGISFLFKWSRQSFDRRNTALDRRASGFLPLHRLSVSAGTGASLSRTQHFEAQGSSFTTYETGIMGLLASSQSNPPNIVLSRRHQTLGKAVDDGFGTRSCTLKGSRPWPANWKNVLTKIRTMPVALWGRDDPMYYLEPSRILTSPSAKALETLKAAAAHSMKLLLTV